MPVAACEATVILFTAAYPYDGAAEQTFLDPEIGWLARKFRQVIVVPERCTGGRGPVPAAVRVDESLAALLAASSGKAKVLRRALRSRLLWRELVDRPALLLRPAALRSLVVFVGKALVASQWVCDVVARQNLEEGRCIFSTFWLDAGSMGIGLAKNFHPHIVLVSRAHGYDLYEERHPDAYIPCREQSLRALDGLFPDSEAGRRYLVDRYPWIASRCETARLGVTDPGFAAAPSRDGVTRVVSCSFLVPLKRVGLLLQGIERAARSRPDRQFEWHHFGNGPLKRSIEDSALRTLPANVLAVFPGYSTVEELFRHYREHPVDVFMNVSETEGTPVSIMEAISCGIPVIATAVGGNAEIVSGRNGLLLSPNPSPEEIAAAILGIVDSPAFAAEKRRGSWEVWREDYNADANYLAYAARLQSIRASTQRSPAAR